MDIFILFVLLFQTVLMFTIIFVSVITLYFMLSSKFMCNAPPVPSNKKIKTAVIQDISQILKKRKNQVIMDLGSGWGTLLIPLAKKFPQHRFIGIEYAYIPYLVSKFQSKKIPNLTFYRQDFFNADISSSNIVFLFLLNHIMPKISKKCQKETAKGTLFYVNRFPMKNMKLEKEVSLGSKYDTYYVYKN